MKHKWPLLQAGHHLCQTFNHRCLDGRAQFPPTIGQPERLAAGYWRGQAEIHCKVQLGIQSVHGIWMPCLKAEVGGTACSGTPGGISRLTDSDELGSCSHLTAGLRCTRVWRGALNDVCGASMDKAMWSTAVEDAMGGQSLSLPKVCPRTPKLKSSRRSIIRSC